MSLYDFDLTTQPIDIPTAVSQMKARGVQTLYLQTSRWNLPDAITDPTDEGTFIDDAHAAGIKVIGWYLPGFADIATDVSRAKAVLSFTSPNGGHFDGLALDIEDKSAVNHSVSAFDAGISSFSRQLRAAVGSSTVLGAIVPDAVNNERYPAGWVGFPWTDIAKYYDVVLPMGYWSVTKTDCSASLDAQSYTQSVISTTKSLMGQSKPMLVVGGVGNCDTLAEVRGYVAAAKAEGMLGASIYSFETVQRSAAASGMWASLETART